MLASFMNLQNKAQYRRVAPFPKSQKSQNSHIVSKGLSGFETFPNN